MMPSSERAPCPDCGKDCDPRGLGTHRRVAHGRVTNSGYGKPGNSIRGERRQQVIDLVNQGLPRNQVAERTGLGRGTISGIAKAEGLTFDRERTRVATEARQVDNKARRAQLSAALLDQINAVLARANADRHKRIFKAEYGAEYVKEIDFVPPDELKALLTSLGTLITGHLKLDAHDSDEHGLAAVDEWLKGMLGS